MGDFPSGGGGGCFDNSSSCLAITEKSIAKLLELSRIKESERTKQKTTSALVNQKPESTAEGSKAAVKAKADGKPRPKKFDDRDLKSVRSDFTDDSDSEEITGPRKVEDPGKNIKVDELTKKLLLDFANSGLEEDEEEVRLIEPVWRLERTRRFQRSAEEAGTVLQLKIVRQWPYEQTTTKPLFQLADLSEQYELMEKKMLKMYDRFPTDVTIGPEQISKGLYAVLQDYDRTGNIYKRIKVLHEPLKLENGRIQCVQFEYIDEGFTSLVDTAQNILYLDQVFAVLPPRITAVKMEGMSLYEGNNLFRRFFKCDSKEFLFDGVLQAEVQASGKVIVWSDRFPKEKYPYGINGFIVQSIVEVSHPRIGGLPPLWDVKDGVYVVHAESNGNVYLQFENAISAQCLEMINSVSVEKLSSLRGSVSLPIENKKQMYFAPHAPSGGLHYRAVVTSAEADMDKVHVRFIDYGDQHWVKVEDLVRVEDVNYLLASFPALSVPAHLTNISSLDVSKYMAMYHSKEIPYVALVTKTATANDLADVTLMLYGPRLNYYYCINKEIVLGRIAKPTDPSYVHSAGSEWECSGQADAEPTVPKLYLGLGQGRRLQVGDQLKFCIDYHESMGSHFFLTPDDNDDTLEKLEDEIIRFFKKVWNQPPLIIPFCAIRPGRCLLCKSRFARTFCRAVIVSTYDGDLMERNDKENEKDTKSLEVKETEAEALEVKADDAELFEVVSWDVEKELKKDAKSLEPSWAVYLLDYGIFETIPLQDIRVAYPQHVNLPALGIRAKHKALGTEEALKNWWRRSARRSSSMRVLANVKICAISRDKYGEVAEVEWSSEQDLLHRSMFHDEWDSDTEEEDIRSKGKNSPVSVVKVEKRDFLDSLEVKLSTTDKRKDEVSKSNEEKDRKSKSDEAEATKNSGEAEEGKASTAEKDGAAMTNGETEEKEAVEKLIDISDEGKEEKASISEKATSNNNIGETEEMKLLKEIFDNIDKGEHHKVIALASDDACDNIGEAEDEKALALEEFLKSCDNQILTSVLLRLANKF